MNPQLLLVATIDDRIVGSVIGGWDGWHGNIYRLAVTTEHRRKGIARRLVAEISRELYAKGATRLSTLVKREHQWAIDFWESAVDLGYERDPKFAGYIADRRDDWGGSEDQFRHLVPAGLATHAYPRGILWACWRKNG